MPTGWRLDPDAAVGPRGSGRWSGLAESRDSFRFPSPPPSPPPEVPEGRGIVRRRRRPVGAGPVAPPLQPVDGGVEHLLVLHDGDGGAGRLVGPVPGGPAALAAGRLEIWGRLEVVQERVRDHAAPAPLPHLLLVPLDQPSALGGQHGHDLGAPRRRRLDGAGGVEVGQPRVGLNRGRGPGDHGPLGVLVELGDLGREALLGRHGCQLRTVRGNPKNNDMPQQPRRSAYRRAGSRRRRRQYAYTKHTTS